MSTPGSGAQPIASDVAVSPASLSRGSFLVALGLVLGVFVFLHPWWEPMTMREADESILWSYYPIPLVVLGLLALERKLGWASWFLETLRLTLVKFAITFLFANTLWIVASGAPGVADTTPAVAGAASLRPGSFEVVEPPLARLPDAERTTTLRGRVVDSVGRPVSGALVSVVRTAAPYVWPAPGDVVEVRVGEEGFRASATLVRAFQIVELFSADDRMHTARATDASGRVCFNFPVLPGSPRRLMLQRGVGELTLGCLAHDGREGEVRITVVETPFTARTAADGSFALEGIPTGEVELAASAPAGSARWSGPTDADAPRLELRPAGKRPGRAGAAEVLPAPRSE